MEKKKVKIKNIKEFLMKNSKILISTVVLLIMLVAATIAWYVLQNTAWINPFETQLDSFDFIVTATPTGDANDDKITLQPLTFTNVAEGKMAPGTYGAANVYVRSDMATEYSLYLEDNLTFYIKAEEIKALGYTKEVDGNTVEDIDAFLKAEDLSHLINKVKKISVPESELVEETEDSGNDGEETIDNNDVETIEDDEPGEGEQEDTPPESTVGVYDFTFLIKKHFKFYKDSLCTEELTGEDPISEDLDGKVTVDSKEYNAGSSTIYWKWLYDVNEYLQILERKITENEDTMPEEEMLILNSEIELLHNDLEIASLQWDYEDNFIGKYNDHMRGTVIITASGSQAQPVVVPGEDDDPALINDDGESGNGNDLSEGNGENGGENGASVVNDEGEPESGNGTTEGTGENGTSTGGDSSEGNGDGGTGNPPSGGTD